MKRIPLIVALVLGAFSLANAQAPRIKAKDLKALEGTKWTGTLTYLDYSSNKKTSIKSDLLITKSDKPSAWVFSFQYPDEPKANDSSTVEISDDGRTFDGKIIEEKTKMPDGSIKLVATKEGTDNDKKALFRYTYFINPKRFSITKEVRVEGSTDWFERNTYSWTRL